MICKVAILLVGITALASASCSAQELRGIKLVKQLEKFLVENVPDNDDVEVNMEKLKEADPSLKLGVDALKTLAYYKGECDQSVLEALGLFGSLRRMGRSRIEHLLFQIAPKIPTVACLDALKAEYYKTPSTGDSHVGALISRFGSTWEQTFEIYEDPLRYYHMYLSDPDFFDRKEREDEFARAISTDILALAGGDPKARFAEKVSRNEHKLFPENFKYAFETYLLNPCREYTESTWKVYEMFYGVSKLLLNPSDHEGLKGERVHGHRGRDNEYELIKQYGLSKYFPSEFQTGLYTYRRCQVYEKLNQETVNESFRTSQYRDPVFY